MNEEKEPRKDWCRLPFRLLQDERLTTSDAVIYAVLADVLKNGRNDIKINDIAELSGIPRITVCRSLDRLEEAGYILERKTDGRRLYIELEQVLDPLKPERKKKKKQEEPEENPEHVEEALRSILKNKLKVKSPENVERVYNDLKTKAKINVKDSSKLLSYLYQMIYTFVDNSDGFDESQYDMFLNNFPANE